MDIDWEDDSFAGAWPVFARGFVQGMTLSLIIILAQYVGQVI